MKRTIAVTRAEPSASATAERIRARGGDAVIAPLLIIAPRAFDANLDGVQALLFTSINGIEAFTKATPARACRVIAVGDATAAAAEAAGFDQVSSADGDVDALLKAAVASLDRTGGRIVHVGGVHTAGDLAGPLRAEGFDAEKRVAFEAEAVTELPPALTRALDVILFHSARAVEIFAALGAPNAAALTAVCLGPRVAAAAGTVGWKRLIVAPAPREEALLDAAFAA